VIDRIVERTSFVALFVEIMPRLNLHERSIYSSLFLSYSKVVFFRLSLKAACAVIDRFRASLARRLTRNAFVKRRVAKECGRALFEASITQQEAAAGTLGTFISLFSALKASRITLSTNFSLHSERIPRLRTTF
jgi:hypothetical protein